MQEGAPGDFDYEGHGPGYVQQRRTDPRIAAHVHAALGAARSVLNVGAGAGSYEPTDRHVVALEPSAMMRAQRPADRVPAIVGRAEQLPFDDGVFDAAMATITIHQWANLALGLRELRRVTRGPIVILTLDGDALGRFWLADYAPELIAVERRRFPRLEAVAELLGGSTEVRVVPIPSDCVDGFGEAFYARPERFLDAAVRGAQSAWGFIAPDTAQRSLDALRADLASGSWDRRFGALRTQPEFEGSLRLLVNHP